MTDVTEIRVLLEIEGITDDESEEIVDWFWNIEAADLGVGEAVHGMAAVVPEDEQGPDPMPDVTTRDEFPNSRKELIKLMRAQIALGALADPDFMEAHGDDIAEYVAEDMGAESPVDLFDSLSDDD